MWVIVLFYATFAHESRKPQGCCRGRPKVSAHIISALNTLICAIGLPYENSRLFVPMRNPHVNKQLIYFITWYKLLKIVWYVDKLVWSNLIAHIDVDNQNGPH